MHNPCLVSCSLALLLATIACGKSDHKTNAEAPPAENIVYGVEFASQTYDWRESGSKVFIAFTDEANQSEQGDERWTVAGFCGRASSSRQFPVVHTYWSGEASDGKPVLSDFGSMKSEDPFGVATCTGGTSQVIQTDASDLALPSMPVSTALASSALVEYVSSAPRGAAEITLTLVAPSGADGSKTFSETFDLSATDEGDHSDIPETAQAAPATSKNDLIPQASFEQTSDNPYRIRVSLLGLLDPGTGEAVSLVADQSVFLTENGTDKGILVNQSRGENALPVDIVIVLDNSGSMYEEAEAISEKIQEFAQVLVDSGIDARLGIVGVNGDVTGGHNLAAPETFRSFLQAGPRSSRGEVFGGPDEDDLRDKAGSFDL